MSRLPCGPGCRTGTHLMHCRDYVGPVVHRWMTVKPNATFGGMDHFCTCGGWFRRGGLAGHGEEPKCSNADETYRNPPVRRMEA